MNENLSSCYYNLAEIYNDSKEYDFALDYYLKSFAIDEMTNKIENLLITTKKIAKIYERQKNELAKNYYEKACRTDHLHGGGLREMVHGCGEKRRTHRLYVGQGLYGDQAGGLRSVGKYSEGAGPAI